MYVPKAIFVLVLAFNTAGCASVVSGTSQTLTLDTVPAGADCTLTRKGLSIGRVNPTPGAVLVQRTRDDITVSCTRDGYQTGTFVNKSGLEGTTFGNIILGGLIGVAIDAASGANNKYDAKMRINLAPATATQSEPEPPASAPGLLRQPENIARVERYASAVAEFHCPTTGTLIRTSARSSYKFTTGEGFTCGYVDQEGTSRARYAIFADGYGRMAKHDLDGLWPLRVGNRVEFRNVDVNTPNFLSKRDYDESFTVVRQEPVTVPAGSFDTFVVEWRETGFSQIYRSDAIVTLWYAPRTGYIVKSAVKIIDQDARDPLVGSQYSDMNYEATEVVLANVGPEQPPGTPPASGTGPSSQPDNMRNAGNPP